MIFPFHQDCSYIISVAEKFRSCVQDLVIDRSCALKKIQVSKYKYINPKVKFAFLGPLQLEKYVVKHKSAKLLSALELVRYSLYIRVSTSELVC